MLFTAATISIDVIASRSRIFPLIKEEGGSRAIDDVLHVGTVPPPTLRRPHSTRVERLRNSAKVGHAGRSDRLDDRDNVACGRDGFGDLNLATHFRR